MPLSPARSQWARYVAQLLQCCTTLEGPGYPSQVKHFCPFPLSYSETAMPFYLILRGGRVVDPSQKLDAVTDVAFADGKVAVIGNALKAERGTEVRDVSGYIVTPGLI